MDKWNWISKIVIVLTGFYIENTSFELYSRKIDRRLNLYLNL